MFNKLFNDSLGYGCFHLISLENVILGNFLCIKMANTEVLPHFETCRKVTFYFPFSPSLNSIQPLISLHRM